MSQELLDFEFFKENQVHQIDFNTGTLDTIRTVKHRTTGVPYKQRRLNVGSKNSDGYIRLWCNGTLRMKHRLLFWLYHNYLPEEVDHFDRRRDNNGISNLRPSNREHNVQGLVFAGRRKFSEQDVKDICGLIALKTLSDECIAKQFSCSRVAIMGIRHKRRHKQIADKYF